MKTGKKKKITTAIITASVAIMGFGLYVWADSTSYTLPPDIDPVTVDSTGHLIIPNPDGEDISIDSNDLRKLADEIDKSNDRIYNVYDHFAQYPHYNMVVTDNNDGTNTVTIEFTEQPLEMPTFSSTSP